MSRNEEFDAGTSDLSPSIEYDATPLWHTMEAIIPDPQHPAGKRSVGTLWWGHDDGEVKNVIVEDEFKRQGIATRMWNEAHRLSAEGGWPRPRHSDDLTPDGAAWSKAVGL
jgi:ribosomal protein S18 acetylase RimI-like enzyme